jgi:hypothetical protein
MHNPAVAKAINYFIVLSLIIATAEDWTYFSAHLPPNADPNKSSNLETMGSKSDTIHTIKPAQMETVERGEALEKLAREEGRKDVVIYYCTS